MSDWDDAQDKQYRRGINGPNTSDIGRMIWRENHPRHIESNPGPSILDLISHCEDPEPRPGFAETAVGPDRAALGPIEPQELLSVHDQGTLPPSVASPQIERERFCACGCLEPVTRSNQKFLNTRHRQRDWIRRKRGK